MIFLGIVDEGRVGRQASLRPKITTYAQEFDTNDQQSMSYVEKLHTAGEQLTPLVLETQIYIGTYSFCCQDCNVPLQLLKPCISKTTGSSFVHGSPSSSPNWPLRPS